MSRRVVPAVMLALCLLAALCAYAAEPAAEDGGVTPSQRSSVLPAGDFFTVVHLSDTQYYSEKFPDLFMKQTQWIRENAAKEHIVFVTHTGDIVQSGADSAAEWDVADKAMSQLGEVTPPRRKDLDTVGGGESVPWGIALGNHDYDKVSGPVAPATVFVKRFGPARFRNEAWYGGYSENGLNSYQFITYKDTKLVILHLEADAPDAALAWADGVLKKHSELKAIVATHIYLHDVMHARPKKAHFRLGGNSAEKIWATFVKTHPQVFMVLSGHWAAGSGEWHQSSQNDAGKKVHELVADYQSRPHGGDAMLRLIRFYPAAHRIEVRTYSPALGIFFDGPDSRFDLPWE